MSIRTNEKKSETHLDLSVQTHESLGRARTGVGPLNAYLSAGGLGPSGRKYPPYTGETDD